MYNILFLFEWDFIYYGAVVSEISTGGFLEKLPRIYLLINADIFHLQPAGGNNEIFCIIWATERSFFARHLNWLYTANMIKV